MYLVAQPLVSLLHRGEEREGFSQLDNITGL